jgi:serine/threonine-protein kinase RsbT
MPIRRSETLPIVGEIDIVRIRQQVRAWSIACGFSLVEQTKMVTAASELARNALEHGKGGEALLEELDDGTRRGVRVTFIDHGPGIPDIEQAMRDGFTTAGGMGHGLGGSKRLVEDFSIASEPGAGTRITIGRWR